MTSPSDNQDKAAKAQRAHRLEVLDSIFRAVPTGIGLVRNRVIVQANDRLCEMVGYAPDELLNQNARMLYPTREEFEWVGREKYDQISRMGTGTVETRWQRKDGRIIDVLLSSTPLDLGDMARGVTFTALDITARKQAEKTVATQKSYLSILHDITLELLNRRNLDDLLQALVVGATRLTGTGDGFAYIIDDETGELVVRAVCGHSFRNFKGFRLKPGQGLAGRVWQSGRTLEIEDYRNWEGRMPNGFLDDLGAAICLPIKLRQEVLGVLGLGHFDSDRQFGPLEREALERLTDLAALGLDNARLNDSLQGELADKKNAESTLRRYEQMVTSSTDYMALLDRDYIHREVNAAYRAAVGRPRSEIIGRSAAEIYGREMFAKHYHSKVDRCLGGEEIHDKGWYDTPGLGRRYIDTFYYPSRGRDGDISGVVIVGRDLTHLKKLEDQFLQSQRMEAVGTLAGGIAHDFNNLLMGIQGRASLMATEIDAGDPLQEHVEAIESYVRSAADLTSQLLGFAQGGKYEISPTDLNDLIRNHNRMFSRTRKELTVQGTYARDLPAVEVDRGQIKQVLLNIYLNAWQAMPEGGAIYVETAEVTLDEEDLTMADLRPGRYAMISVKDTGVGMDDAVRQRVFEPFFTTRPMGHGTGLGLASAYGIVKNHGGAVDVSSEKGHGSAFRIYLPATRRPAKAKAPTDIRMQPGAGTVMLVDDEKMIIEVATAMLEKLGYDVLAAADGESALALYRKEHARIDLVVLDMVMPGMGGGETFDRLKAFDPGVKVLLSSGYSLDGQATEIIRRGCIGFIQKPFSLAQLSEKLKNAAA